MILKSSRDSPGADGFNNSKNTWIPQDDILDEIELKGYQPVEPRHQRNGKRRSGGFVFFRERWIRVLRD